MADEPKQGVTGGGPALLSLTRLFELSARSLHSASHSHGLYPAQWSALRYLASADASACTSSALARFQQLAVGPVTRTVRTLIEKGLVRKAGMGVHHRSERLELTPEGHALLAQDPLRSIDAALRVLDRDQASQLASILGQIIASLGNGADDDAVKFEETFRDSKPARDAG